MSDTIKITNTEVLSDNWYTLRKVTYEYQKKDGSWQTQSREAYDRGNGATILLYNTEHKTVILTRQFRLPSFINGNPSGMLIEACAEILYFFVAEYSKDMKVAEGGGIEHEQEDIDVLEITLDAAMQMTRDGEIKDGKTIMLLQYAKLQNLV